jgi:hypothetical protein
LIGRGEEKSSKVLRVVGFCSRTHTEPEPNLALAKQQGSEALGAIWAIRKDLLWLPSDGIECIG